MTPLEFLAGCAIVGALIFTLCAIQQPPPIVGPPLRRRRRTVHGRALGACRRPGPTLRDGDRGSS